MRALGQTVFLPEICSQIKRLGRTGYAGEEAGVKLADTGGGVDAGFLTPSLQQADDSSFLYGCSARSSAARLGLSTNRQRLPVRLQWSFTRQ